MEVAPRRGLARHEPSCRRKAFLRALTAVGASIAFTILGLSVVWSTLQIQGSETEAPSVVVPALLALLILGALLAGLSRRYERADVAARERGTLYQLLADHSTDMIVKADLDTTRRYVSPAVKDLLGYEPAELLGTRPLDGVHPDDVDAYRSVLELLIKGEADVVSGSQRYRRKDGSWVWTDARFRLLRNEAGQPTGYVASVRDISERKQLEDQLWALSRTDALTGVYNRRGFDERLEEEWRRAHRQGTPLALLLLDVDFFKQFNDHSGHSAGDECLKRVADALQQGRRLSDFVARVGGEEFALLLPGTDARGMRVVADEVRSCIEAVGLAHPQSPYGVVTVSVGTGIHEPPAHLSTTSLLEVADRAMYEAKKSGKNRVVEGRLSMFAPEAKATSIENEQFEHAKMETMAASTTIH